MQARLATQSVQPAARHSMQARSGPRPLHRSERQAPPPQVAWQSAV